MEPKTIVSVLDPALDRQQMQVRKYAETRDPSLIRELPGKRAVRFRVRDLSVEESMTCDAQMHWLYKARLATSYALLSVDLGNGEVLVPTGVRMDAGERRVHWLDHEYAALVRRFGKARIQEVGSFIAEMDEHLGEDSAGSAERRYTLPALSRDVLALIERQHAAKTLSDAETPSSES